MVNPREGAILDDGDDPDAAYVWRLMIDAAHQRKGHGSAALQAAVGIARDWSLPRMTIHVVDAAGSALPLYQRAGFVLNGRVVGGELELVRSL